MNEGRQRLEAELKEHEQRLVAARLSDRAALEAAWQERKGVLDELERLRWLERAEREAGNETG